MDIRMGQVLFNGEEPMNMVAAEGLAVDMSQSQRDLMERVVNCLAVYLKATAELLGTRYRHLQPLLPDYLSRPGNVLASIGSDGIVVRFERRSDEHFSVRSFWQSGTLKEAVSQLSQNMLRCVMRGDISEAADHEGVNIVINATTPSTGERREIESLRLVTRVTLDPNQPISTPPAKPHCAASLLSSMMFRVDLQQDAARVPMVIVVGNQQTPVGWECIQIFPSNDHDAWIPQNAQLWAELDILAQWHKLNREQETLRSLDPRREARRLFRDKLNQFRALLDQAICEEDLQMFLKENPFRLCPTFSRVWPKLRFGDTVSDFVFAVATDYLLVEIEHQRHNLFTKSGNPTAALTHAITQTVNWSRYIEDNLTTVRCELKLTGITTHPKRLVVIGRDRNLSDGQKRLLRAMEEQNLKLWTYDDVYTNAKTTIENFLGPLDEPSPNTDVFYPIQ